MQYRGSIETRNATCKGGRQESTNNDTTLRHTVSGVVEWHTVATSEKRKVLLERYVGKKLTIRVVV